MGTKKLVTKQHVGKIAEALLLTVAAAAGVISVAVLAPNALQLLKPFLKHKKYSQKRAVDQNIDSLIRAGLLRRTIDSNGHISVELTQRGIWESFLRGNRKEKIPKKWDGIWRVVVFDVPEVKKNIRDELRRGIRLYGFHQLQQSVWVYPYPCD